MKKKLSDILEILEVKSPSASAESWDNVGLLAGNPSREVHKALVANDLDTSVVDEAIQIQADLIVTHHPCIFPKSKGISRLSSRDPLFRAIEAGIAVASYHTDFDQAALEVVQAVSEGLRLKPMGRLFDRKGSILKKLVVYVPATHVEEVRTALCEAGAGHIGQYDYCTFGSNGEGSFRGGAGTTPFLGTQGQIEKVQEVRLETVLPFGIQTRVIQALLKSHPYEEVAYDIYSVEQQISSKGIVSGLGYGFWGEFPSPKPFSELTKDVKSLFNIHGFWITGPVPSQVTRVGFVAGKGTSFVEAALQVRCDVLITGEAGYHGALSGSRRGLAVVELGHRESEKFFIETMKKWLLEIGLEVATVQAPIQQFWSGGM